MSDLNLPHSTPSPLNKLVRLSAFSSLNDDEVLIRVSYASVNKMDAALARMNFFNLPHPRLGRRGRLDPCEDRTLMWANFGDGKLGHVDISTTDIYARADTEMKRKALEHAYPEMTQASLPDWNQNEGLLSWLGSL